MKWLVVSRDGLPKHNKPVVTFSEAYRNTGGAYRLMDGQFVRTCIEATHYAYLEPPDQEANDDES